MYDAQKVVAYLDTHTTEVYNPKARNAKITLLNHTRMTASQHRSIDRWRAGEVPQVTLAAFDRLLVRVGLHLSDYERWAEEEYAGSAKVAA